MYNLSDHFFQMMALAMLLWPFASATSKSSKSSTKESEVVEVEGNTERQVERPACVMEQEYFQYPADLEFLFDDVTGKLIQTRDVLYKYENLTEPMMTADMVCDVLDEGRFFCNAMTTDYYGSIGANGIVDFGRTTATGIVELEDQDDIGGSYTATWVFTGGTDFHAGVHGNIFTVYNEDNDVVVHTVCVQASQFSDPEA
mmetsp:Transcript_28163/g.59474  ORF Transcript_28163/g.59474 Transcript_28163/m.59474 type:complete len:200 (+) Transcript_28163:405-1004(+)|eukprot:CAMPEP_0183706150 /NCGR_PEP_ID=MMETSP0737-20130205/3058_1 /TAXON_ID=385413 /ORGANISM="Thalassiosira miniscula, Strain CCMP1093" /LENGTH=199 /DNA_ID=CAMNT_0025933485 /DNA_START=310 /DNA_END=909 /DNA_ORIENTATION=-